MDGSSQETKGLPSRFKGWWKRASKGKKAVVIIGVLSVLWVIGKGMEQQKEETTSQTPYSYTPSEGGARANQPYASYNSSFGAGNMTLTGWASDAHQTLDLTIRPSTGGGWTWELKPGSEGTQRRNIPCESGKVSLQFELRNVLGELVGTDIRNVDCAGGLCWYAWVKEDGARNRWGEPTFITDLWEDLTVRRNSCA